MTDSARRNITRVKEAFGVEKLDLYPEHRFEVDGVEFVCGYEADSTPNQFCIVKHPRLSDWYFELTARLPENPAILELGIAEGGSTALLALLTHPSKLIALDIDTQPVEALSTFIDRRSLTGIVRLYYGVNQADRTRLVDIAEQELTDGRLDLVIDDASHALGATKASFEALFPRLRPGGLYVIEDWNNDHQFRDAFASALEDGSESEREALRAQMKEARRRSRQRGEKKKAPPAPLSRLAVELLLARTVAGETAVAEVTLGEFWIVVQRGRGELDMSDFRLQELFTDHFGYLSSTAGQDEL